MSDRHGLVLIFGGWTLFVWGGRLRNLWLDQGGLADANRWSLAGAIVFSALGLAVVIAWLRRLGSFQVGSVLALAALTVGVWLIRAVDIAIGDHSFGFIAVHVVLAAVSIGLAVPAARSVLSSGSESARRDRSESGRAAVR